MLPFKLKGHCPCVPFTGSGCALQAWTCLEDVRVHGADSVLQHGVLVPAVKVVKEMYIVQRILALHGEVNAVLAQYHIFFLQTSRNRGSHCGRWAAASEGSQYDCQQCTF